MKFELCRVSYHGAASQQKQPHEDATWDIENEVWFIDIDDVDDILRIVEGSGVIITAAYNDNYDWAVHIYDDYFE